MYSADYFQLITKLEKLSKDELTSLWDMTNMGDNDLAIHLIKLGAQVNLRFSKEAVLALVLGNVSFGNVKYIPALIKRLYDYCMKNCTSYINLGVVSHITPLTRESFDTILLNEAESITKLRLNSFNF